MTARAASPTPTDLVATATNVLERGGYHAVRDGFPEWNSPTTRLYEDEYGVVGLAVFSSCGDLVRFWADLQGSLVDVISRHVGRSEGKAWDGYLVLLTPGVPPSGDLAVDAIRADTTRLRKIVGTGDELSGASDTERLLLPLLPLKAERALVSGGGALDFLPRYLADRGVPSGVTAALLRSFRDQKPLMEALYGAIEE